MLRFLVLALALCIAPAAQALDAAAVAAGLPRHFRGTFQWDGQPLLSDVDVRLNTVSADPNGDVLAQGDGEYKTGNVVTKIKVLWRIDPKSLAFEMLEGDPEGTEDFVTDGSHRGRISSDLLEISAIWITRSTGSTGRLILKAGDQRQSLQPKERPT